MAVRRNVLTTGTARPGPAGAAMALRWKEFSHDDALGDDSLPSTPGQPPRVPVASFLAATRSAAGHRAAEGLAS